MTPFYDAIRLTPQPTKQLNYWINQTIKPARAAGRFEASAIPFTPTALVKEIFDQIPPIKNRCHDSKIAVLYTIEMAIWLTWNWFENVTLITREHDPLLEQRAEMFGYTYMTEDKVIKSGKKFDVVIGNPPYQAIDRNGTRNNKKDNLWSTFIELAKELVVSGGYVALITPTSWMSPGSKKKGGSLLENWFLKNQLIHLEVNTVQCHFPGVGSQFSWYVVQHVPYTISTTIRFLDVRTKTIQDSEAYLCGFTFLPPMLDRLTLGIFRRTVFTATTTLPFQRSTEWATYKKEVKARSHFAQSTRFCYAAFHTTAQILYFDFPSTTIPIPKVMISLSGYPTPMLDTKGEYGITECGLYCDVNPDHTYSVVSSKLYQFILRTAKWSGFNSQWLIQHGLPAVDLTRSWTDQELYDHFNLTQDEIDLIERTVK